MACVLRPEQFQALMEYATSKAGGKSSRRDAQANCDLVKYWLTSGPHKGMALSDFQRKARGRADGAELWAFLEGHFGDRDQPPQVAEPPHTPEARPAAHHAARETPPHKPSPASKVEQADYSSLTLKELRDLCRERKLLKTDEERPHTKTCLQRLMENQV